MVLNQNDDTTDGWPGEVVKELVSDLTEQAERERLYRTNRERARGYLLERGMDLKDVRAILLRQGTDLLMFEDEEAVIEWAEGKLK